jgi:hypothetical protein
MVGSRSLANADGGARRERPQEEFLVAAEVLDGYARVLWLVPPVVVVGQSTGLRSVGPSPVTGNSAFGGGSTEPDGRGLG